VGLDREAGDSSEPDFVAIDGAGLHFEEGFTVFDSDGAVAGGGGEEAAEVAGDSGL